MGHMKLLIGNKYNLKLYNIPEIIEDSYLLKYHSSIDNKEKIINILNRQDKLIINNNLNLYLYENDKSKESIELELYKNYKLLISDTEEELYLYCLPNEMSYKDYKIKGNRIKIGQSPSNEIAIADSLLNTNIIEIIKAENIWYVKSDNTPLYVNKSTTTYSPIKYGDEIFVAGLKIIWLKGFLRINQLPNATVYLSEFNISEFYEEYKTPVVLNELEVNNSIDIEDEDEIETILLENPPVKDKNNDLYYFIALGSSFTLAITSVATLLTIFLGVATGSSTLREEKTLFITSICLLVCSILFPMLIKYFQKINLEKREGKRILQYSEYLKNQKGIISKTINKRADKLKRIYPDSEECQKRIFNNNIWTRKIDSTNFLKIRFGTGDISADITIDSHKLSFTYENELLKEQLNDIQNSSLVMKNVPIPISLIENRMLPLIINEENYKKYIDMLLLQITSFHSNSNLKIIFLVSEENHNVWNNYKFIPHILDEQNEIRFFAYDKDDNNNVISYLEETYQNRIQKLKNSSSLDLTNEEYYKTFPSYYLIITDKLSEISNYEVINKIINDNANYGFSILSFAKADNKSYIDYKAYLEVKKDSVISHNIKSNLVIPKEFKADYTDNIDIYNIVKTIANLPIISYNNKAALPKELSLLDIYKVGKFEQLNILDKWKTNNPVLSLKAPIGLTSNNEVVDLDLHEKQQGPHAIIAGMVGSGKLELLKTYITSMCINYSPDEVQFVLVDYKNGGLVKAFKNQPEMPHIVGALTELDTSELFRFHTTLKNEIAKRKEAFLELQNKLGETSMNIYKYQKLYREGATIKPLPHLFIVCYEYAELFNQYHDYFTEFLNMIYSSNSTGLHLILTTQKPSEVIDNQIMINSRLKICLKVQSLSDSEEVLKRREAASLNNPGRFYYEVGYNETFKQVQCAYSNSIYVPEDTYTEKIDDSISFITNSGLVYKEVNEEKKANNSIKYGQEIESVKEYISLLTKEENIRVEDFYLPSIDENIALSKLIRKYKYKTSNYQYNAIVGEYDNPSIKEQNIYTIDVATSNNIIIYGLPGSGKISHISTILFSLCLFHSPKELNAYVLDNNDEALKSFGKMPQVGEYIPNYDTEKAENLLTMLNKEIKKRKSSLKDYETSFVINNEKSAYKVPLILVVIRDYQRFLEKNKELEEQYNSILNEGPNLGIVFITSVTDNNALSKETSSYFKTILGTRFADPFDYRYVLDAPKGLIPKNCYGRGLAKINGEVVEYQNAFIASREEIDKVILENAIELKNNYKTKAKPILVNLLAGDKKNEK